MKEWRMTAADFYKLLKETQDYRCFLSGRELHPGNTSIVLITPLHQGGKKELSNVCLIDSALAGLARRYSISEIRSLCLAIARYSRSRKRLSPATIPRSKTAWHAALDRVKNFNRPQPRRGRNLPAQKHSWGQCATDELRKLNSKRGD